MSEVPPRLGDERAVPRSVTVAIGLVWAIVALAGVTALLTWLLRDALVRAWAHGNAEAMALIRDGGVAALDHSSITVPAFISLAVTSFLVIAGLAVVLAAFLRSGHGWARWCLVALVVFAVFTTGISLARGLPPVFVVLAAVSVGLDLALLRFLFHRDTNAYLRVG